MRAVAVFLNTVLILITLTGMISGNKSEPVIEMLIISFACVNLWVIIMGFDNRLSALIKRFLPQLRNSDNNNR